jgi:hypothetical protein
MFPPVESQVIFLSKETPIVSVDLRNAEVSYTNQSKTAWKSEVVQTLGWPLPICVQTLPSVNESFWLAKFIHPNKTAWKSEVVQTLGWPLPICVQTFPCVNESFWLAKYFHPFKLFSQSKSPLELSQFSRLWHLSRMQMGFRRVCTQMGSGQPSICTTSAFHAVLFWFVYDTSAVRRSTLTIGVSLERKITWLSTGGNIFWKY